MNLKRGDWIYYRPNGIGKRMAAYVQDVAPGLAVKIIPATGYLPRWIPMKWVAKITHSNRTALSG